MYQGVIFQFINVEWKKMSLQSYLGSSIFYLEIAFFMEVDG